MSYAVEGIGDVRIKLNNAKTIIVSNVLYVPSLSKNLLSIIQLTKNPSIVNFSGKQYVVSDIRQDKVIP